MPLYDRKTIEEILPHRAPFLFVDRVVRFTPGRSIVAELDLREDEPHFKGHFPGRPMMPGVLVSEAAAQTAGLLLAFSAREGKVLTANTSPRFVVLAAVNMKYLGPSHPGETLTMRASFDRTVGPLSHLSVEVCVGRRDIASGSVVLAEIQEKG